MNGNTFRRLADLAFSPRYLFMTNTIIGVGAAVGVDYMQQITNHYFAVRKATQESPEKVHQQPYVHDYKRSLGMAFAGMFCGIGGHFWYKKLDTKFAGHSISSVSKKLVCEIIAGPPFISAMFYCVARVEGKSTAEWYKSWKQNIVTIILTEWCGFIPLQALNFYLLPPKYRYLCVGVITIFYDYFLSFIFHN